MFMLKRLTVFIKLQFLSKMINMISDKISISNNPNHFDT